MKPFAELFQTADWKSEKHAPVIEVHEAKKEGIKVTVSIGKEIPHPNTTAHHISWIQVYFLKEGEKFPYELGKFEFNAHGASTKGPDTSTIYTHPKATFEFKSEKPGTLYAFSYCNIHGLWANHKELEM
ncbi:MAG: class II SORL domain-containing protein [Asgard group archaeon]|nr:class II SORL domain-containing protein [Asgard group archaeon]